MAPRLRVELRPPGRTPAARARIDAAAAISHLRQALAMNSCCLRMTPCLGALTPVLRKS